MSSTSRVLNLLIAEAKALGSIATKVPHPQFLQTSWHTDRGPFGQSYSVAAFTILFYDHLLTLADEVGYYFLLNVRWPPSEPIYCLRSNTPGLERNRGVRPSSDAYPTFY